jgi:PAS domain S-box-containing protein
MAKPDHEISEDNKVRQLPDSVLVRFFASSVDVLCSLNASWRFEHISPACLEMWGHLPGELYGETILSIIHPEDRDRTQVTMMSVMNGVPTRNLENRVLHKDGRELTTLWSMVWSPSDRTLCCVARDMSEHRQAEAAKLQAVHALENFKRALDEHAIVAVTDARGRITYANEQFCQISKYPREELLGRDHRIINSNYHSKTFFRDMWQTILSGKVWRGEIRNRAKDGGFYWVDTTIVPFLDGHGKPVEYVAIRADITQKKNSESALLQAQKLESIGVLAGGIAHDFNNILTGVLGYAELANFSLTDEHPAHTHLQQIETAALKAADLTRQLLAYAGKGRYILEDVNLNVMIQEMTPLLSVNISKKAVIRYDLAPSLPPITADTSQIQQVVMNLVTNAFEAIGNDNNGVITIRTGVQNLDDFYVSSLTPILPLEPGRFVMLEVADTGCGMSADVMGRIFDPFFTTKFTGRGLGLSAMLGILRSHKGSIKIYSETGKGSTFKVFLPVVHGKTETPAKAPVKSQWSGKGTILVVDDEPFARSVARAMSESVGLRVVEASDGQEGVEIFRKMHAEIDLVLMDLTMPQMDGRQAFEVMHAVASEVPVILSSGYSEQEAIGDFAGRGLVGFLPKPYQVEKFRETIRQAFEKSKAKP